VGEITLRSTRSEIKATQDVSAEVGLISKDMTEASDGGLQDSFKVSVSSFQHELDEKQDKVKESQRKEVSKSRCENIGCISRETEYHDLEKQKNHQKMPEKGLSKNGKKYNSAAQDKPLSLDEELPKFPDEHPSDVMQRKPDSTVHSIQDRLQKTKSDITNSELVNDKWKQNSTGKQKHSIKSHNSTRPVTSNEHLKKNEDDIEEITCTPERVKVRSVSCTPISPKGSTKHSTKGKSSKKLSLELKLNDVDVGKKDSMKILKESHSPRKLVPSQTSLKPPKSPRRRIKHHTGIHHKRSEVKSGSNEEENQEHSVDNPYKRSSSLSCANSSTEKLLTCETKGDGSEGICNAIESDISEDDEESSLRKVKLREVVEDTETKSMTTANKKAFESGVETFTERNPHSSAYSQSVEKNRTSNETLSDKVVEVKDCDLLSLSSVDEELQKIKLSCSESSIEEELEGDDVSPAYSPIIMGTGVNIFVAQSNDQMAEVGEETNKTEFPTTAGSEGKMNINALQEPERFHEDKEIDNKCATNSFREQSEAENSHSLQRQAKQFHNHSIPSSTFIEEEKIEDGLTPQRIIEESSPDTSSQGMSGCNGKSGCISSYDKSKPNSEVWVDKVSSHQPLKYRVRMYKKQTANMAVKHTSQCHHDISNYQPFSPHPPTVSLFPEKRDYYANISSEKTLEDMNSAPADKMYEERVSEMTYENCPIVSPHEHETNTTELTGIVKESKYTEKDNFSKRYEAFLPIDECKQDISHSTCSKILQDKPQAGKNSNREKMENGGNAEKIQKQLEQMHMHDCTEDCASTDAQSKQLSYHSIVHGRVSGKERNMVSLQNIKSHENAYPEAKDNKLLLPVNKIVKKQHSMDSPMKEAIDEKMKDEGFGEDSNMLQLEKSSNGERKFRNVFKRLIRHLNMQRPHVAREHRDGGETYSCGRVCRSEHILRPQLDLPGIKKGSKSLEEIRKIKSSFKNRRTFLMSTDEKNADSKSSLEKVSDDEVDVTVVHHSNCSLVNHSSNDLPNSIEDIAKDNF